ncbi:MAG TPA: sulfur carrier protein ThiS [Pirellulales bacterium]|nr:sulfur carrier protein ThiS [Pirellulales bacterium]
MQSVAILVNGEPCSVSEHATVAALLAELGLSAQHVAVEVNLQLVPRTRHAERRLATGDRVEVVSLVGGG